MKFQNDTEVVKAAELTARTSSGKRMFSLSFKKALLQYVASQQLTAGRTQIEVLDSVGVSSASYHKWATDYKQGLFDGDAVYSVSRTVKQSNQDIEEMLQAELEIIKRKIELIRECKKLGLKVAA